MKAITVRQPWAHLAVTGKKLQEYRRYRLPIGRLAIHSSRTLPTDEDVREYCRLHGGSPADVLRWCLSLPRGVVVGEVVVTGAEVCDTRWGTVANNLDHAQSYGTPIPACGQLGVWTWDHDAELAEEPSLFEPSFSY